MCLKRIVILETYSELFCFILAINALQKPIKSYEKAKILDKIKTLDKIFGKKNLKIEQNQKAFIYVFV